MEKRTNNLQTQPKPAVMFCNNCGGKGHLFRTCKDPILSCGLILIDKSVLPVNVDTTSVLMVRRKDSLSFAEFMRGKYDLNDEAYIGKLFSNMTIVEQATIACNPFDVVWKKWWGDDRSPDYPISKEKFEKLNRLDTMVKYMSTYTEPEWGFPKGKRVRGETDLDCAIREFTEETNIPRDSYVVMKNIVLEETFMGLNNIRYKHIYFLAILKNPEILTINQKFTPMQRREISAVSWKTFKECEDLIRPHHTERHTMMAQLKSIVETFETF